MIITLNQQWSGGQILVKEADEQKLLLMAFARNHHKLKLMMLMRAKVMMNELNPFFMYCILFLIKYFFVFIMLAINLCFLFLFTLLKIVSFKLHSK